MVRTERPSKIIRVLKLSVVGVSAFIVLLSAIVFFTIYGSNSFLGLTSTNAVIYIIKDSEGLKIKNDIDMSEVENLLFMFDATCLFYLFESVVSALTNTTLMEFTWNREGGNGIIKEIRPDGSKFLVVLSRYYDDSNIAPSGLFIGGDLPYGDFDRWLEKESRNNTGIAYYDGDRWYHIWCNINEALSINGDERMFYPRDWFYEGSRVVKNSGSEIILESYHSLSAVINNKGVNLFMKRTLYKKQNDDYVVLRIEIKNKGDKPLIFSLAFGDEPWVGDFGDSRGDIGWYDGGVIKYESGILPDKSKFAGYWDRGNDLVGEKGPFTGYANFIEWLENPPNYVYFSNSFGEIDENRPLESFFNRVINLLWLYQTLMPGESRTYSLALGMAKPDFLTGLPLKPDVILSKR